MKRILGVVVTVTVAACAHLTGGSATSPGAMQLWNQAHHALASEQFQEARTIFQRLASEYPESTEGRESHFYLGGIHMDPRNPNWNPGSAAQALERYLSLDDEDERIFRRPEAVIMYELAEQLNLPPEQRRAGLQPETRIIRITPPVEAPEGRDSTSLVAEVERLRQMVAERDSVIQRQREELERIRRTLTPRTPE